MAKTQAGSSTDVDEVPEWDRVPVGQTLSADESAAVEGVVVPELTGMLANSGPAMQSVIAWCVDKASYDDSDEASAMESMVRRMLEAESIEDVLRESLPLDAKAILGIPVLVNAVRVGSSDFQEGMPYYVIFDAVRSDTGEACVITCGGFMVVAQAFKLDVEDAWPQVVMFQESAKPTKKGFRPLSLVAPVK